MPARMGSFLTGVVHRQLEMVSRALLRFESSFFVWELLHQTGAKYSATEKTSAWVGMCRENDNLGPPPYFQEEKKRASTWPPLQVAPSSETDVFIPLPATSTSETACVLIRTDGLVH